MSVNRLITNNGVYSVYYTPRTRMKRMYKVVYNKDTNIHTHRYNEKESIDLANFAKHCNLPKSADIDYLTSLERIAVDQRFRTKVNQLIRTKRDKQIGNRKYYHDNPVGYKY